MHYSLTWQCDAYGHHRVQSSRHYMHSVQRVVLLLGQCQVEHTGTVIHFCVVFSPGVRLKDQRAHVVMKLGTE